MKDKLEHIWEYYKFNIIGAAIALYLIGSAVFNIFLNPQDDRIMVAWMGDPMPQHQLDELSERLNARIQDLSYTGDHQHDMMQRQLFSVMSMGGEIDAVVGLLLEENNRVTVGRLPFNSIYAFVHISDQNLSFYVEDLTLAVVRNPERQHYVIRSILTALEDSR